MKTSPSNAILFALNVGLLFVAVSNAGRDSTLEDQTSGADVVEATIQKITTSGIFPDDFSFLRRIAWVESKDGTDAKMFTKLNRKGIWQLSRAGFDDTRDTTAHSSLTAKYASIKSAFNIDWTTVTFEDMNKPLHSALAVRLFLSNKQGTIPVDLRSQAQHWKNFYNEAGSVDKFYSEITELESKETQCDTPSIDVVFVLDSSGSITAINFRKILNFVQSVVGFFDVGENKVHVGVIEFSDNVVPVISLNQSYNITILHQSIAAIPFLEAGTNTAAAIDELVNSSFLESNGARPSSHGVPRVGIVVTDGESHGKTATMIAASRAHASNIRMFAIGVGNVNMEELNYIGTDPDSKHVFLLTGFTDFSSFANQLKRVTCAASTILDGQHRSVAGELRKDQKRYIEFPVNQEKGGTVQLSVDSGAVVVYVSMAYSNPSEVLHDQKASVKAGDTVNLHVLAPSASARFKRQLPSGASSSNTTRPAFVTIYSLSDDTTFHLTVVDGNAVSVSGATSLTFLPVSIVCLSFFLFSASL